MAIRAIGFDIDGTLYSSALLYLRLLPFSVKWSRLLPVFGAVRRELHHLALDPRHRANRPAGRVDFQRFQAELAAPRLRTDPETAAGLIDRAIYVELEETFSRVKPYRGLPESLELLKKAGFRLAALSDFPAADKLERLGLGEYFELALSSEDSGLLKPATEPFLALAAGLGLEPSEILFVGNSPSFDIAGACAAGMRAALRGRRKAPGAELVFTEWRDLVAHVLADNSSALPASSDPLRNPRTAQG